MEIRQPKFQINDEVRFIDKDKPGIFLICSIADYDFKEDKYSFELVPFSMDATSLDLGCISESALVKTNRKEEREINMEIQRPKYVPGDKVLLQSFDNCQRNFWTFNPTKSVYEIKSIGSFHFDKNEFFYVLKAIDDTAQISELNSVAESNLQLYRKVPKSIWELKDGDSYIYTDGNGNIKEEIFTRDPSLLSRRNFGNVFLDQKEAAQDLLRRLVETNLLKLGGRRWYDPHEDNYYITYNYANHSIVYVWSRMSCMQGTIFFNSESEAEEAVAEIGERQIKKALFGVDE